MLENGNKCFAALIRFLCEFCKANSVKCNGSSLIIVSLSISPTETQLSMFLDVNFASMRIELIFNVGLF